MPGPERDLEQHGPVDVVVVGSANVDLVLAVRTIPRPGETVLAGGCVTGPGGKGANQAVAAARSGASTAFVGAVGDDHEGTLVRGELGAAQVRLGGLRTSSAPTGRAYVMVDPAGENAIVVDPGANADVDLDDGQCGLVADALVVLCQLEIPLATVTAAVTAARGLRMLNAAPAQPLPDALCERLDVLVVNQQEALVVAGGDSPLPVSVAAAVAELLERVPEVIVTLGADGVLVGRRGMDLVHLPAVPARAVVDTTGAGDTFCGAYAAARAAGVDALAAVDLAGAAASLSVEQAGAARSAPTLAQVRARLADIGRGPQG